MTHQEILIGDCRAILPTLQPESVQCCVTSPPYWGLRDYGVNGQLGLESTPEEYIANLVEIFRQVWRVLRDDGTLWLVIGDSYASSGTVNNDLISGSNLSRHGSNSFNPKMVGQSKRRAPTPAGLKPKDLCMMPARVAMALQADGWYLRSDIIWHKPNPMPESVTDRPTSSHDYIFLFAKQERYFFDAEAIREPAIGTCTHDLTGQGYSTPWQTPQNGNRSSKSPPLNDRNKRDVWTIATQPYAEAHFAAFPEDLIKPCILAGSRLGDMVLDPFAGSGTTGKVALELGRRVILVELNPAYIKMAQERTFVTPGFL